LLAAVVYAVARAAANGAACVATRANGAARTAARLGHPARVRDGNVALVCAIACWSAALVTRPALFTVRATARTLNRLAAVVGQCPAAQAGAGRRRRAARVLVTDRSPRAGRRRAVDHLAAIVRYGDPALVSAGSRIVRLAAGTVAQAIFPGRTVGGVVDPAIDRKVAIVRRLTALQFSTGLRRGLGDAPARVRGAGAPFTSAAVDSVIAVVHGLAAPPDAIVGLGHADAKILSVACVAGITPAARDRLLAVVWSRAAMRVAPGDLGRAMSVGLAVGLRAARIDRTLRGAGAAVTRDASVTRGGIERGVGVAGAASFARARLYARVRSKWDAGIDAEKRPARHRRARAHDHKHREGQPPEEGARSPSHGRSKLA
jgi:hypothetical protein